MVCRAPGSKPIWMRIRALTVAGAPVKPSPFHPVIHAILLGGEKPLYLSAQITGGHGSSSQISDTPNWSHPSKIAAKYLAPYLEGRDQLART